MGEKETSISSSMPGDAQQFLYFGKKVLWIVIKNPFLSMLGILSGDQLYVVAGFIHMAANGFTGL